MLFRSGYGGNGALGPWTGGASGVVILRYSGTTQKATGGTVTTSGGNTIHTFTSSGTFYTGLPKATGGTISFASGYWYHAFTASGTFTPAQALSCDVLVVAGGGAGGARQAGGGGAGGIFYATSQEIGRAHV